MAVVCLTIFGVTTFQSGGTESLLPGPDPWIAERWGVVSTGDLWRAPWRLLTAVFLHAGAIHLGMNLLALADLGRTIERDFGTTRLLFIFLVTGIGGFAAFSEFEGPRALGASGGIFGLLGAWLGGKLAAGHTDWKRWLIRVVVYATAFSVVLRLLGMHLADSAHLAGGLLGFPLGYWCGRNTEPSRTLRWLQPVTAALVLSLVLGFGLTTRSARWQSVKAQWQQRQHQRAFK